MKAIDHLHSENYPESLPGAGALIWHIDETSPSNKDPQKLRVKLIQADGADHLLQAQNFGDPGDAFSAASINTRFGVGTPLCSAYVSGEPSNILLTFDLSTVPSSDFVASVQPMAVMVSRGISQPFNPADYQYSIYLPLAQR